MIITGDRRLPNRSFFLRCPRCLEPASLANAERYGMGAQRLRCDQGRCTAEAVAHVWSAGRVGPSPAGLWARIRRSVGR
jgi:hypothetical protein